MTCPELKSAFTLNDDAIFFYAIDTPGKDVPSYLCGRIESSKGGWVGFGIAEPGNTATGAGAMDGAQAVIASPDDGTVLKYDMKSGQVSVMDNEKQTLVDTEVTQEDGVTKMSFAKLLVETDENEILANGDNAFLYALGSNNNVGYHGYGPDHRATFTLDFGSSFDFDESPSPTMALGGDTGEGIVRTLSPTPAEVVRPPTPDTITPAPTPKEEPVPTPTPPVDAPSSAMSRRNIGTVVVLGAGSFAAWFGMM